MLGVFSCPLTGSYEFVQVVMAPVNSMLIPVIGARTAFNIAICLAGTTTVAFGYSLHTNTMYLIHLFCIFKM